MLIKQTPGVAIRDFFVLRNTPLEKFHLNFEYTKWCDRHRVCNTRQVSFFFHEDNKDSHGFKIRCNLVIKTNHHIVSMSGRYLIRKTAKEL